METHVASEATTIAKGGGLADRYAAALYAHADEAGALDAVVSEMESLGSLIDTSSDFRRLIESPLIDVTLAPRPRSRCSSSKASASTCAISSASSRPIAGCGR